MERNAEGKMRESMRVNQKKGLKANLIQPSALELFSPFLS
jgi:hypothetical protein